jgi:hypothetical protein
LRQRGIDNPKGMPNEISALTTYIDALGDPVARIPDPFDMGKQ